MGCRGTRTLLICSTSCFTLTGHSGSVGQGMENGVEMSVIEVAEPFAGVNVCKSARRWWFLTLTVVMLVTCGSIRPLPVRASWESAHVHYQNLNEPYMEVPAMYGNTIMWAALTGDMNHPAPERLYTSDIRRFHPRVVVVSKPGNYLIDAHVSLHWLVWIEQTGAGDWLLWAQNRHSNARNLIDSSARVGLPPHPLLFPMISLDGDYLAWSLTTCTLSCHQRPGHENWSATIVLQHLPSGLPRSVATVHAPCSVSWPALSSQFLAWHQEGKCDGHYGSDVVVLDRRANSIRVLTRDHHSSEPTTNGRFIAWKNASDRLHDGMITLVDLQSGSRISASGGTERCVMGRGVCAAEPVMSGSIVAWSEHSGEIIVARDLKSGRRFVLARENSRSTDGLKNGHIGPSSGRYVIWQSPRVTQDGLGRKSCIGLAEVQ